MSDKLSPEEEQPIRYRNLYEKPDKIYIRKISGFYQSIRRYTGIPLIVAFALLPWLTIDGRPAVLFDLPARQFHVLWLTFWPQDFMLLAWLLIISAFSLFAVTTSLGRVWCGFTCPQTVWTLIFFSVEHFFEGDRNKQVKLDNSPWNFNKIWRKTAKHAVWLAIAFATGATFIGYFLPVRELLSGMLPYWGESGILTFDIPPAAAFWTFFFTAATYLNAGYMREQVCKYMCPYARFQSVMYDNNTLAVYYDVARGEPRGARKPKDDPKEKGLGDCTDCSWCVQVCPVDIDIRDGLQYECINCGLCVDACNAVMDKMNYDRGLIRFTSEVELKTGNFRFFRPRVIGYVLAVVVMATAFIYTISSRTPLSVDVIRDRGARLYRINGDDVQNVYTVKINNMDNTSHSYTLTVSGDYPFRVVNYRKVEILPGEVFTVPVRVAVERKSLDSEKARLVMTVTSLDDDSLVATETTSFLGPAPRK
ncbi:cytochrome c oxidase accessory protein CcoG [Teredinibacter turnerae]|uniref:cytochrome c oxidase accessory protein CcoG n=1 Tax=Teredinibacter turnerae TaxID=2426 RepID=UPI00035F27F9|nr:cytochrome c oxidase accessory protein CcoG [Teredinibacter turnerae]